MSPTVIAYNEVYNAIQNGVISAGENEAAGVEAMKFYEVAPNLVLTQHAVTIRPICFSVKTFKTLDKGLQDAIVKAGKEAGDFGRELESSEEDDQARHAGEGRQAEAHRVRGARRHEEAGRSGDGGIREGTRRRGRLRQDQRYGLTEAMTAYKPWRVAAPPRHLLNTLRQGRRNDRHGAAHAKSLAAR